MPRSLAWRVRTRSQPQSRSAPAVLPAGPARALSAAQPRLRKCVRVLMRARARAAMWMFAHGGKRSLHLIALIHDRRCRPLHH